MFLCGFHWQSGALANINLVCVYVRIFICVYIYLYLWRQQALKSQCEQI